MVCKLNKQINEELAKVLQQLDCFVTFLAADCCVEKDEGYDKHLQTFYHRVGETTLS